MEGFGPFKNKETIDFSDYDTDGLFLITGPTGAGKSTILDAVCFALYGDTPRWHEPGAPNAQVRSDYCSREDKTEVILEFEVNGVEYRIRRSPQYERTKERGEGTTFQQATASIELCVGGPALAVKPTEVADFVQKLVKLKADEFLQVILLAQGRFQKFLLADSAERLGLLKTLFDIGRFAEYDVAIDERRKQAKSDLDLARLTTTNRIQTIVNDGNLEAPKDGEELAWMDAIVKEAESTLTLAKTARSNAAGQEKLARDALSIAEKQRQRADAEATLTELLTRGDGIKTERTLLASADRAARVLPLAELARTADDVLADIQVNVETALGAYDGAVPDDPAQEVTRLNQELGKLQPLIEIEDNLTIRENEIAQARDDVEKIETLLIEISERKKDLDVLRKKATKAAQSGPVARQKAASIKAQLEAAENAVKLKGKLVSAQDALLTASTTFGDMLDVYNQTLARYLHGQAAVLAEQLVPGTSCPVCGSLEHPAPATWDGEPVTEADLKKSESERDSAEGPVNAAKNSVVDLEGELRELAGKADDKTVEQLNAEKATADEELRRADSADQLLGDIDVEINGDEDKPGLTKKKTELAKKLAAGNTAITTLTTQVEGDRKRVDAARGDFASTTEHITALTGERDLALALVDARARHATAAKQATGARLTAENIAKGEKFDSLEAALEVLIEPDELAARHDAIAAYDQDLAGAKALLAQAVLKDLPVERIDVNEAQEAVATAEAASSEAISASSLADARYSDVVQQRTSIKSELKELEGLADRYKVLHKLAETVRGKAPNVRNIPLESYVAAAELETILEAANQRLHSMSDGRYELQHSERGDRRKGATAGLEIEVLDEHTGRARSPRSLSGGETFLASLALALGLAEVVTSRAGGIELKTLFIDEGFGSLDGDTLEVAMITLDTLRQGGRAIGVISHVDAMKDSITSQLRVAKTAHGWSEILKA
jgi:exonuclease SbcC